MICRGIVFVLLSLATACGGIVASSNDGGPPDSGPWTDAGWADGGATDAPAVLDAAPPPADAALGAITFQQGSPSTPNVLYASFTADPQHMNAGCTGTVSGACTVFQCPNTPPPQTYLSAGTLTIQGGSLPPNGVAVMQQGGTYSYDLGAGFKPNDTLSASGSGAQVPAFSAQQVIAPGPITLTSPSQPYTISLSQDLIVTWSGGEANAQVFVEALAPPPNSALVVVACTFDALAGTGKLPQAMLAALGPTSSGQLFWAQQRRNQFLAGSYPIQLLAVQLGSASATFQ